MICNCINCINKFCKNASKKESQKVCDGYEDNERIQNVRKLKEKDLDKFKEHGFMTVADLKKYIKDYNVPDNAIVLIERVEDVYYNKNNWGAYVKYQDKIPTQYSPAWCCVKYKDDHNILFIDKHY